MREVRYFYMRCWLSRLLAVVVCLSVLFSNSFYAHANGIVGDLEQGYETSTTAYSDINVSSGNYNLRHNFGYGTWSNDTYTSKEYLLSREAANYFGESGRLLWLPLLEFDKLRPNFDNTSFFDFRAISSWVLERSDDKYLCQEGEDFSYSVNNIYYKLEGYNSSGKLIRSSSFNNANNLAFIVTIYDKDNYLRTVIKETVNPNKYVTKNGGLTFKCDISNVPFDVYKVQMALVYKPLSSWDNNDYDKTLTYQYWANATKLKYYIMLSDDSSVSFVTDNSSSLTKIKGFLMTIIEWFKDTFNMITDSFSTLFTHILELPSKLWNLIENGLKALFVPSEDFIKTFVEDFKGVIADRFGFLYETGELITDMWDKITDSGTTGKITIPKTTVNLAGTNFSFGGWNVDLVPEKFQFLLNMIKLLTSAFATVLFVNGMKNKFTRLMEGNE